MQQYLGDKDHLFKKYHLDSQLQDIFDPKVTLKSGGYIIIDQTEALVAIDVNSGKSTRERTIEDTALKNNLEAAEEFARQARLRDLSGLIVIDFIDMEENKNRSSVEKKLKDSMKKDRARIQIGEISNFGLLELSRQRLRPSVVENSSEICPHCGGSGRIQSIEVSAVQVLRSIEEEGTSEDNIGVKIFAHSDIILHILNKKRFELNEIEKRYNISINFINDNSIIPPLKRLETIKKSPSTHETQKEASPQPISYENEENLNKRKSKKPSRRKKKVSNDSISSKVSKEIKADKQNGHENTDNTKAETLDGKNDIAKNKVKKLTKKKREKKTPQKLKKIDISDKKIDIDNRNTDTEINDKKDKSEIRELKSSTPIEVVTVGENSSNEKPKKKGWWSK